MLSPEVLQRYPLFADLDDIQRKAIGLIAKEEVFDRGATIFEEGQPAENLYILMEGCVDLYYAASAEVGHRFLVTEVAVGEPFGFSALLEPGALTATAKTRASCRVLKIKGVELRALCEVDADLGYTLMRQSAKSIMGRLHAARVLLANAEKEAREKGAVA